MVAQMPPASLIVIDDTLPEPERRAQYAAAMPMLEKALDAFRADDQFDESQLSFMDKVAQMHLDNGRRDLALPLLVEALGISRRVFPTDHDITLTFLVSLTSFHRATDDHEATLPLLQEVVDICRRTKDRDDQDLVGNIEALADVYHKSGQPELGLPFNRELLASCRRRYGDQDRRTLHEAAEVGCLLVHLDQAAEGGPLVYEAMVGMEKILGENHEVVQNLMRVLHDLLPDSADGDDDDDDDDDGEEEDETDDGKEDEADGGKEAETDDEPRAAAATTDAYVAPALAAILAANLCYVFFQAIG